MAYKLPSTMGDSLEFGDVFIEDMGVLVDGASQLSLVLMVDLFLKYLFLMLQTVWETKVKLLLNFTKQQLNEQYGGKLEKELSGPLYEVVSKIFRVLINMKITVPGNFIGFDFIFIHKFLCIAIKYLMLIPGTILFGSMISVFLKQLLL
uniref:Transmembrane protein n=1 Tax=Heterorhabditis bacteriophora TaxID=37862 RepID=A0A1I7XAL1_HETBA